MESSSATVQLLTDMSTMLNAHGVVEYRMYFLLQLSALLLAVLVFVMIAKRR